MAPADLPVAIDVERLNFFYGAKRALEDIAHPDPDTWSRRSSGRPGAARAFLRTLNRMNDIIAGTRVEEKVVIEGRDVYAAGTDVVALRRRVGMVFQKSNPFPKTIFENVAYGIRINGLAKNRAEMHERVEESLRSAAIWGSEGSPAIRPWPCRAASSSASASPARWQSLPRSC